MTSAAAGSDTIAFQGTTVVEYSHRSNDFALVVDGSALPPLLVMNYFSHITQSSFHIHILHKFPTCEFSRLWLCFSYTLY